MNSDNIVLLGINKDGMVEYHLSGTNRDLPEMHIRLMDDNRIVRIERYNFDSAAEKEVSWRNV